MSLPSDHYTHSEKSSFAVVSRPGWRGNLKLGKTGRQADRRLGRGVPGGQARAADSGVTGNAVLPARGQQFNAQGRRFRRRGACPEGPQRPQADGSGRPAPRDGRRFQDDPRTAQDPPKTKTVPGLPRPPHVVPKTAQDDGLKTSQEAPTAPRRHQDAQDDPRRPQDLPGDPQDDPRPQGTQDVPKAPQVLRAPWFFRGGPAVAG